MKRSATSTWPRSRCFRESWRWQSCSHGPTRILCARDRRFVGLAMRRHAPEPAIMSPARRRLSEAKLFVHTIAGHSGNSTSTEPAQLLQGVDDLVDGSVSNKELGFQLHLNLFLDQADDNNGVRRIQAVLVEGLGCVDLGFVDLQNGRQLADEHL